MARKIMYQGVPEEKVSEITMDEFYKMTSSRNRRTLKRLKNNPKLKAFIDKVRKIKASGSDKMIKTHMRGAPILPEWVGLTFGVYNGKEFKKVEITAQRVGARLGDFSFSVGRVLHSGPGVGATRGSKFVPLK
jgi:small subunit ribosomal protein S19